MENVILNNGVEMPILGFGVFQMTDATECERSVGDAIEVGYRLIDTAAAYHNEGAVGRAIKSSGVAREELFITTKLWHTDAGYDSTMRAFDKSMEQLGLEYMDLYLIHQPFGDLYGAWRAMEELYHKKQIRAIGISNFLPDRVMDFLCHNEVIPAVNQIELHPFHQQNDAMAFLAENKIQVQGWAPFAEGKGDIFNNEVLLDIAKKYDKTVAQIVLRSMIQRGISVIPKSTNKQHIIDNIMVFDFEITQDDMARIALLDAKESSFFDHRNPEIVKWICGL